MKVQFKIKEVKPRIFLFEFKNHYDLCMTFLRYQEHYESPSPKFRGKAFSILEFMEWYSKQDGKDDFTYMRDWSGFNLPGSIIWNMWNKHLIPDKNYYDYTMYKSYLKCLNKYKDGNFYIIGAQKGNLKTLKHEIAHSFYYVNKEYYKEANKLIDNLTPILRKKIFTSLKKLGYTPKVFRDECQAYLVSGWKDHFSYLQNKNKPFLKLYKKFYNK